MAFVLVSLSMFIVLILVCFCVSLSICRIGFCVRLRLKRLPLCLLRGMNFGVLTVVWVCVSVRVVFAHLVPSRGEQLLRLFVLLGALIS